MKNDKLNQYILHYLTEDKTKSAIMLTAPWGTGKSYYIQTDLKPFLEEKHDVKCIIVSLYGLKDLFEVSKALYLECRAKFLNKDSEKAVAGKFAAKTIVKGVTSFFGIDLSKSADEMEKLYSSVDLSGKLIILEDLERSGIDVLEVLGYVNNLVEQDGVKVLLVANEKEILTTETVLRKDKDDKEITQTVYTNKAKQYLRTKEKTVSDTILFAGNIDAALEGIIKSFQCKYFDSLLEQKNENGYPPIIVDIRNIMETAVKCDNLRSVIFGCQKTADMCKYADDSYGTDFVHFLLCGNVAYALRAKNDDSIRWDKEEILYSYTLGTYTFPLLQVSYDYIKYQQLKKEDLDYYKDAYYQRKAFEKAQSEIKKQLDVIYNFYEEYEADVANALSKVTEALEKTDVIPYTEYGKLANYLVSIHSAIGHDDEIGRCKKAMVEKLKTTSDKKVLEELHFHSGLQLDTQDEVQEFSEWKKEMIGAVKSFKTTDLSFDYRPESASDFYRNVAEHRDEYMDKHRFAAMFDVHQLETFIKKASPRQIGDIRGAFREAYYISNIGDFFADDKESLIEIKEMVDNLIKDGKKTDKIVLLQLRYFSGNLQSYIDRL